MQILAGPVSAATLPERIQLGDVEVEERYRLACQTQVWADLTVLVAPAFAEAGFQILARTQGLPEAQVFPLDSGVHKVYGPGDVTTVFFDDRLLAVEPGDTRGEAYGMAFDVGTTTVVGYLIDLLSGTVAATVSALNPQEAFGADVMSRLAFAQQGPGNVRQLHARVVRLLNEQIEEACRAAGVRREQIYKIVPVGNSVMHHVVLGLDPTSIGHAPFAPVIRHSVRVAAHELGLQVGADTPVFFLPLVAGFVGADTVAMVLSTRIFESREVRLAVDMGTNGEVVIGSRDGLTASSVPAGPTLEGGQLQCGMRAARGAIDQVRLDQTVHFHVIGDGPPLGVCGSGVLDAVAGMLDAGLLDESGRLNSDPPPAVPDGLRRRIITLADGAPAFVLARGPETASGRDVLLTQADVRQVQLAKGAIRTGIVVLQRVTHHADEQIGELMLAGGLGNYLNIASALRLGLIPPLPRERVRYVGNAAGLGAQMAVISETERRRADELAAQIRHVSLATHPEFEEVFLEAMHFPCSSSEN